LVVDDSAVYRKIITKTISQDPQIEVVGTAANGRIAIDLINRLKPDVVTLDLEMPEMNGLETLDYLNKLNMNIGIIVFSSHSQAGAKMTFDALEKGAFDFVPKPSNNSFSQNINKIASLLVPKIKICYVKKRSAITANRHFHKIISKSKPLPKALSLPIRKKEAVAIGVSTGGPSALKELLSNLDPHIAVPIFIVQHMPPVFTSQFAERLDKLCRLKVKEAENGELVKAGVIYIAPGDYHMEVNNKDRIVKIRLHKGPPENNCRPAVDVLFRSVAEVYNGKTLAIILTGMGSDGLKGAKVLKEKGAYIIAQDESSSVVWGMPKAVVEAGLADKVVPLYQVPKFISDMVKK